MGIRSRSIVPRCPACYHHLRYCICAEAPHLQLKTKVTILSTSREQSKTTNTARLVKLILAGTEIVIIHHGLIIPDPDTWLDPAYEPVLLFPWRPGQENYAAEARVNRKPLQLVVPDGTWKEGRKLAAKILEKRMMPALALPAGQPSGYILRRGGPEGRVCTFEAISRALSLIEGPEIQEPLDTFFRLTIDTTLKTRGQKRENTAANS